VITQFLKVKPNKRNAEGALVRSVSPLSACVVAYKDENNQVRFGFSQFARSKEDVSFSKTSALKIALARAEKGRGYTISLLPQTVKREAIHFVERCNQYFKAAPINLNLEVDDKAGME